MALWVNQSSIIGIENIGFEDSKLDGRSGMSREKNAIGVTEGFKGYGNNQILQGLNMNVKQGTIYALLGSSGCGKTTLLSSILGTNKLDSGDISIYGFNPSSKESGIPGTRVGYMPQEISLFEEFTIKETMGYFGAINGMTEKRISGKYKFLSKLLKLPSDTQSVKSLSGGQKRRVSFAVALLHDPQLLILDEPTVGVDPLLRQAIWRHLVHLVSRGNRTVIITTHYIEEAESATTVITPITIKYINIFAIVYMNENIGLMRNGKLISEESPTVLCQTHGGTLQEIVLKLCLEDKDSEEDLDISVITNWNDPLSSANTLKKTRTQAKHATTTTIESYVLDNDVWKEPFNSLQMDLMRLKALLIKNFIGMFRNLGFLLFLFFVPTAQIILFCLTIGGELKNLSIGVINMESFENPICKGLDGVCADNSNYTGALSCNFLDQFINSSTVKLVPFTNHSDATFAVKKGDIWGYMEFPENFTQHLKDRALYGNNAELVTILGSTLKLNLDKSNSQATIAISTKITEGYEKFLKNMLDNCNYDPAIGDPYILIKDPFYERDAGYTEYVTPSILLLTIFFMAITLTSTVVVGEKRSGILNRSLVSGVTYFQFLVSHVIAQYAVMVIQSISGIFFTFWWFGLFGSVSLIGVVGLTLMQGTLGMLIGLALAAVSTDDRELNQLTMALFMPNILLSGAFWPIEGMPSALKTIAMILPTTLPSQAIRGLMSKNLSLFHQETLPGFYVPLSWIAALAIIAIISAKIMNRN